VRGVSLVIVILAGSYIMRLFSAADDLKANVGKIVSIISNPTSPSQVISIQ